MGFDDAERSFAKKLKVNKEQFDTSGEKRKSVEDMEQLFRRDEELLARASRGEIDFDTYEKEKVMLDEQLGVVEVDSIMELRVLLKEAGYSPADVDYWAAHENAHANKAQELGLPVTYRLFRGYVLHEDGTMTNQVLPAVHVGFEADDTHDARVKQDVEVTSAPDELSDGDRRNLESLRKKD